MKKNYNAKIIETKITEFNLKANNKKDALEQVTDLINNSIILEHKDVKKVTNREIRIKRNRRDKIWDIFWYKVYKISFELENTKLFKRE